MRILWITNVELPDASAYFHRQINVGGWMNSTAQMLGCCEGIELTVASAACEDYQDLKIGNIRYFGFTVENAAKTIEYAIKIACPDCIHIWGTEYGHSLHTVEIAERMNLIDSVIVSIQGLVSVYAKHYTENLPLKWITHKTIKEHLGRQNILQAQRDMQQLGMGEIEVLRRVKHCIGRTDWDLACVRQINPQIQYHFCNETLRKSFYQGQWDYGKCVKYRIFFSQAHYPIKGLHMLLRALPEIRNKFPETTVRVVGDDPRKIKPWKRSSYQQYIIELLEKNKLNECVAWTGGLSEARMKEHFLESNVFVCASSIENSSNSIGEAMLLGMPVVASDVGGIKSLMKHEEEGLIYQCSAEYMLADCVNRVFESPEYAMKLGNCAKVRAEDTHDVSRNYNMLMGLYRDVWNKREVEK